MSNINHIQQTHTFITSSAWVEGDPIAKLAEDGMISVQPTGCGTGALHLIMTVERWRQLNDTVEAAITDYLDERLGNDALTSVNIVEYITTTTGKGATF